MSRDRALALLLPVALALALVLPGISRPSFLHEDEYRNGVMVREMAASGLTLFPKLHERPYTDYPPLYFAVAALVTPSGSDPAPWALRLPAAIGAALIALGTALLGMRLGTPRVGLRAGLLCAVLPGLVYEERRAMIDPLLAGLTTMAVALFAAPSAYSLPREAGGATGPKVRKAGRGGGQRRRVVIAVVALALAWLTKGPLAAVVVSLALAGGEGLWIELRARQTWLLFVGRALGGAIVLAVASFIAKQFVFDELRMLALGVLALVLVTAELVWLAKSGREGTKGEAWALGKRALLVGVGVIVIASSWYGAAYGIGGADFCRELIRNLLERGTTNPQHAKDAIYTAEHLPVLLPVALVALAAAGFQKYDARRAKPGVFALGSFVLLFLFFSWSKTKRSYYLMPAYPFVAVLASCGYEIVEKRGVDIAFKAFHVALFAALALAAAVAPIVAIAEPDLGGQAWALGASALLGAIAFGAFAWRERLDKALVAGSAFALAGAFAVVSPMLEAKQGHHSFARALLERGVPRGQIACAPQGVHRESLCWELAPDATHGLTDLAEKIEDQKKTGRADPASVRAFLDRFPPGKAAVFVDRSSLAGPIDPSLNPELEVMPEPDAPKSSLVAVLRRR